MQLHELKSPKGARKRRKIVGRGRGSGWGKTSGRGENGQKSRPGRGIVGSSEGGQMPLLRRLPKFGFTPHRIIVNQVVNVGSLDKFPKNTVVNAEALKGAGLINSLNKPFKILGRGEIKVALNVQAFNVSKSAIEKIEKAGGKVEILVKSLKKEAQS